MEVKGSRGGCEVQESSECVAIPLDQEEDRQNSSTPHVPSGFLCPSNLGALLESTTISLVAGGWKETRELNSEVQNGDHEGGDVEKVHLENGSSDVDCCTEK